MEFEDLKDEVKTLDKRVKRLEYNEIRRDDKIGALCDKLEQFINMGKWLTGLMASGFVTGFFALIVYIIESHIK